VVVHIMLINVVILRILLQYMIHKNIIMLKMIIGVWIATILLLHTTIVSNDTKRKETMFKPFMKNGGNLIIVIVGILMNLMQSHILILMEQEHFELKLISIDKFKMLSMGKLVAADA
ncbi:hypothetical protein ACJX0J_030455, partial [Zea mays]